MANSLQRASFRRKVLYFGLILALFTVSIFWRGKLDVPFGNPARAAEAAPSKLNYVADVLSRQAVRSQAEKLELRELDQGDPEIAGSTARLALIGSRGVAVTGLWWAAIEKQKRNEFHEFEILVRAVTRLQPNFITPWIFQSWNIAYNVSVENEKLGDMYFYIARGIELLAEGDRLNTKVDRSSPELRKIGSPDIRYQVGFYYQNKFGVSDKVQTLRCLMQLSNIAPTDRRPESLLAPGGGIDPIAFRRFCEKNPQLVRRLRTKLNCSRPEEVVQFLADNEKVPTLFKRDSSELADASDQFPILPPQFPEGAGEYTVTEKGTPTETMDDTFDAFLAARAWFAYSLTVVPPPKLDRYGDPIAWSAPDPTEYNQFRYRVPRAPALIIFRQSSPRSQTYYAERLMKEGWFDDTSTWNPDENASAGSTWFPPSNTGTTGEVILKSPTSAKAQWSKAWDMWNEHGQRNALVMSPSRRQQLEERGNIRGMPATLLPDNPEELAAMGITPEMAEAQRSLFFYEQNRTMTNFAFFLESSRAEKDPVTVEARKLLWDAEEARQSAKNLRATRLYIQALAKWREVLVMFPQFHRAGAAEKTEEDTYEYEVNLVQLLTEDGGVIARAELTAEAARALCPAIPEIAQALASGNSPAGSRKADDFRQAVAEEEARARVAVESVLNIYPRLSLPADSPEKQIVSRVDEMTAKSLAATENIAGGLGGVIALDAVRDPQFKLADRFRSQAARQVIDAEFAWMKEFKVKPTERDAWGNYDRASYWVSPVVRETVRNRLGLVRKAPESAPAAPPGMPAAPQEMPTTPPKS